MSIDPIHIHGLDGQWILAASQEDAQAWADRNWPDDEAQVVDVGWMCDVGWDADNYETREEFVADTGLTRWWQSCQPPEDAEATSYRMRAFEVRF